MKTVKNKMIFSLATLLALGAFSTLYAKGKPVIDSGVKTTNEWYVSTRVSVSDTANSVTVGGTNPAVFGKLAESSDGYDKHDITPYGSVVGAEAAVVFIHSDWDENSGEYHSNYHDTKGAEKDSWEMTVFSSVDNAEVTLKWEGLYELSKEKGKTLYDEKKVLDSSTLENLKLVDTVTGEETPAVTNGKLNTYSFTMESGESSRIFIWQQGMVAYKTISVAALASTTEYIEVKQKKEKAKAKKVKKARAKKIKEMKPEHRKFGLPPESGISSVAALASTTEYIEVKQKKEKVKKERKTIKAVKPERRKFGIPTAK